MKKPRFKKSKHSSRSYNFLNLLVPRVLSKIGIGRFSTPIFPGFVAHYGNDILKSFHNFTVKNGEPASIYFDRSGIRDLALRNGGVCSFHIGGKPAIYQVTNVPLIEDTYLSPSTGPNKSLFGEFMGTYPSDDPIRKKKRLPVLKILSNPESIQQLKPLIYKNASDFLKTQKDVERNIEDFTIELVSYVDSFLPGIIDTTIKPLTSYLTSQKYGKVMREFFELASDVISKLDSNALSFVESIVPFVRDLIHENFESIADAPQTNIIKQYMEMEHIEFTHKNLSNLPDSFLKELGTIIIALYDTTSLSLYWLICYIESNPKIKQKVIEESKHDVSFEALSYIELVILETIRLAGGNPTALWREVIVPTDVKLETGTIRLEKGTLIWLDRRNANQDKNLFPCPYSFNPDNISSILHKKNETPFSILSNNRYEINSFSMVNTFNNPRKCPGRFFSVFMQSCLIRKIYANYQVNSRDVTVERLRKYCSMPRPDNKAKICITLLKNGEH